jgi:YARHG domain
VRNDNKAVFQTDSNVGCNNLMSRRAIILVVVFVGVLLAGNIVVLSIWLPILKSRAANVQSANRTTVSLPATPSQPNNAPLAPAGTAAPSSDLVLERQFTSPSGNLQIKYFRDRKTKTRRITVEDAHRPGVSAVLFESKRTAWAVISPDEQWIAVDERNATDGGGARFYHRSGNSSVQYVVAEGAGPEGRALQDTVWQSYLNATHASPGTPRRGATIDATGWENDSRKLDVSVVFLSTPQNPDVPEPWRCTYDVASKQVEPAPDQPAPTEVADNSANEQTSEQSDAVAENVQNSETANTEDNEFAGERFPGTRLDELTVPDVNESSLSDITYAINEMFARHGVEFKDKKITKQFEQFSWYKPRPGLSFDEIETEFSDLEKQNLKVLGRCRDAKLAAARHKSRPVRGEKVEEESTGEKILRGIRTWQDLGGPMPPHP